MNIKIKWVTFFNLNLSILKKGLIEINLDEINNS